VTEPLEGRLDSRRAADGPSSAAPPVPAAVARFVALYLPQFHPIPENDAWWGPGFTEWTNVSRARPLFRGHAQPQLPAELGYYDLRLAEARQAQAELASRHGIEAFCYYHYWFGGRRLLERPFEEVLKSGRPELPFCLCWANESWARSWLGDDRDLLIEQTYSAEDDVRHAQWLLPAFADPRYLKIRGRALFLVYRPRSHPEPRRLTDTLREQCGRAGVPEPYLVGVDAHCPGWDPRTEGFDDTMNFAPQLGLLPGAFEDGWSAARWRRNLRFGVASGRLKIYDYERAVQAFFASRPQIPHFPTVLVGWDNSPRRGRQAIVIANATPERFAGALRRAVQVVESRPPEERIVFINAWNEWAESNHLEPDARSGRAYLEVVRACSSGRPEPAARRS
jgi:lipopolysaccharide biosynthesis protein